MRGTVRAAVLIALVGTAVCNAQDGFKWTITDKGTERELQKVDMAECIHEMGLTNGRDSYYGTAVHIGGGWFITAGHLVRHAQEGRQFTVDGKQVTVKRWEAAADDFGLVIIPSLAHLPSADWSRKTPAAGEPLVIMGKDTKRTAGIVSKVRPLTGELFVDLAQNEPMTEEGDSGGAVINTEGHVVGVHTSQVTSYPHTTSFVPLNRVARLLGKEPHKTEDDGSVAESTPFVIAEKEGYLFTAPWCVPCRTAKTHLPEVEKQLGKKVHPINVDVQKALVEQYQIKKIPTWVFLEDGKEVSRHVGTEMPVVPK